MKMKYHPLPVLSQGAQNALKQLGAWPDNPLYDDAFEQLFQEGLIGEVSDDNGNPIVYITHAGFAYLEGRQLPMVVIPSHPSCRCWLSPTFDTQDNQDSDE
jgi:hypothetical protein